MGCIPVERVSLPQLTQRRNDNLADVGGRLLVRGRAGCPVQAWVWLGVFPNQKSEIENYKYPLTLIRDPRHQLVTYAIQQKIIQIPVNQ